LPGNADIFHDMRCTSTSLLLLSASGLLLAGLLLRR
jgi:hypothetical protein